MIALVEGAKRQKTPNEIALSVLLAGLTLIFLIAVVTLWGLANYSGDAPRRVVVLVALLVSLIPTTIGGLLSAIGIAGMDRLMQFNVLATSGRAVEAAGDVDTLLLDKTGTITFGNRMAERIHPVSGRRAGGLAEAALAASLADETPEGRSIVALAKSQLWRRRAAISAARTRPSSPSPRRPACRGVDVGGALDPQGRGRRRAAASSGRTAAQAPRSSRRRSSGSAVAAARRWRCRTNGEAARRHPPEGHGQARH